jgi:hypothetical protein
MVEIIIKCFPEGAILRFKGQTLDSSYALSVKSLDKIMGALQKILPKVMPFEGAAIGIKDEDDGEPKRKKK